MRQILINLVGNAIKFTETGGVRLVTRLLLDDEKTPCLWFDVIDSGIGVTTEQAGKLFRPFTQADSSTSRKFGGAGLGLAISRRMARELGGDIRVTSRLGEGSTFSLIIETGPLDGVALLENPVEAIAEASKRSRPAAAVDVKLDCHVLLAEDGPDNQRLISFILRKAGAQVTVVENGLLACQAVLAAEKDGTPFDVVLMDMQMPVMDGYQATRGLRKAGHKGPVIALTANAMFGDEQKCREAGCNDYLTKPIDMNTFLSVIGRFTRQSTLAAR